MTVRNCGGSDTRWARCVASNLEVHHQKLVGPGEAALNRENLLTIVGNGAAIDGEVNSSLEDGIATGVAVDTDPCRGRLRATSDRLGGRDNERSGHCFPSALKKNQEISSSSFRTTTGIVTNSSLAEDGTGPVGAVLDVGDASLRCLDGLLRFRLVSSCLATLESVLERGTGKSCAGEEEAGEDGGEDHDENRSATEELGEWRGTSGTLGCCG